MLTNPTTRPAIDLHSATLKNGGMDQPIQEKILLAQEVTMRNPKDYDAGWTTPFFDPVTGQWYYGGAARLVRMARMGGAYAVEEAGGNAMLLQLSPLMNQLQDRIAASEALNLALIERLENLINSPAQARR